jgi:hypothetical protein
MPIDTAPPVHIVQVLPKDFPRGTIPGGVAPLPAGKFTLAPKMTIKAEPDRMSCSRLALTNWPPEWVRYLCPNWHPEDDGGITR